MTHTFTNRIARTMGLLPVLFCLTTTAIYAQTIALNTEAMQVDSPASTNESAELPDAPLPNFGGQKASAQYSMPGPEAPLYSKYIPAGWHAQNLNTRQKMIVGVRDLYTPESLAGYVLAAGYSHVTNGEPNYGTDMGAFGQRVGASFARGVSEAFFSDVVLAPILHEDSRYYVKGPGHSFFHRAVYAASRTVITRNDQGRSTVNGSLILGYAGAAALSTAYYPETNRNARDVVSSYGGSLGGAALGFVFEEFSADLLQMVHLNHKDKH